MAPLRARLEESLHKINDKLKPSKRPMSDESEAGGQQSKQARTLPSQTNAFRDDLGHHPFGHLQSPSSGTASGPQPPINFASKAPSGHIFTKAASSSSNSGTNISEPIPSRNATHRRSRGSSRRTNVSNSGASSSNPIDLTNSSPPSTPPSQTGASYDPMDLTGPDCHDTQMLSDAKLAKLLQDEWNREVFDTDRSSSNISADDGVFGSSQELSSMFNPSRYQHHLSELRCSKCRAAISLDWDKLTARTRAAVRNEGILHPFFQCGKCKLWSCVGIGCGQYQKVSPTSSLPSSADGSGLRVSWCCDGGREFLVFVLCCGPDGPPKSSSVSPPGLSRLRSRLKSKSEPSPFAPEPEKQSDNPASAESPKTKLTKHRPPKFASQLSKGTGYGGSEYGHHPFGMLMAAGSSPLTSKAKSPPPTEEPEVGLYFTALSLILPSNHRADPTAFDLGPQSAVKYMLSRSPLLPKALQLLRQSCVEELVTEHNLYSAVLDFACALTKHADLLPVLYTEAVLYPYHEQLGPSTFNPTRARVSASGSDKENKTQSIDALLQKLAEQCEYFVQKASVHLADFKSPEEKAMLALTQKVITTAKPIALVRPTLDIFPSESYPGATKPKAASSSRIITRSRSAKQALNAELEKVKSQCTTFHREHCILELPDDKILEDYHFANQARAIEKLKFAKGRMKKLVTQVTSLRTDLPEGIYVRHGASRFDVMKILIVGPDDTPYQDGLFEFDLFCGSDFPSKPPDMHFRTTGMGKVAFNPNLYNNGKVCLSLLGTWSGQGWEPERSTLLQILVSIQAMIFTHQPWYNEPGREYQLDETASRAYNKSIWHSTIRHAMVYWLNERLHQPDKKGKGTASFRPRPTSPAPASPAPPTVPPASTGSPSSVSGKAAKKKKFPIPPNTPSPVPQATATISSWVNHISTTLNSPGNPSPTASFAPATFGFPPPNTPPEQHPAGPSSEQQQSPVGVHSPAQFHFPMGVTPENLTQFLANIQGALPAHIDIQGVEIFDDEDPDFYEHIPVRQTRPYGNTAVDSNDDYTWGHVIRAHFGIRGAFILKSAQVSPFSTDAKALRELEQALEKHGFHQP